MTRQTRTIEVDPVDLLAEVRFLAAVILAEYTHGRLRHNAIREQMLRYFPYAEQTYAHDLGHCVRTIYNFVAQVLNDPGFCILDYDDAKIIMEALDAYEEHERVALERFNAQYGHMVIDGPRPVAFEWSGLNDELHTAVSGTSLSGAQLDRALGFAGWSLAKVCGDDLRTVARAEGVTFVPEHPNLRVESQAGARVLEVYLARLSKHWRLTIVMPGGQALVFSNPTLLAEDEDYIRANGHTTESDAVLAKMHGVFD